MRSLKVLMIAAGVAALSLSAIAQQSSPAPGPARPISVPAVTETKLPNGLTVAVVERRGTPLVTVQLLIKRGSADEAAAQAGLADMTAAMLTKGTSTRTSPEIAESIEFLGATIGAGAFWSGSYVNLTSTSDKTDAAMAIMADVVTHPKFADDEFNLLMSQTLDDLKANFQEPSFLTSYVASAASFGEHPVGGTPKSIEAMTSADVKAFYDRIYSPANAVLIFAGDISQAAAVAMAKKYFGSWRGKPEKASASAAPIVRKQKFIVIDLPDSGQAAVTYAKRLAKGRMTGGSGLFYKAITLNSVLGGGYSSRLNFEIRIKRGLSYGAGSNFKWRANSTNLLAQAQTKNESAAEVASLMLDELKKLASSDVSAAELTPRKAAITGGFARDLETTSGLAIAVSDLFAFSIPRTEFNSYVKNVDAVTADEIKQFAGAEILGGDILIAGDYKLFKDDLAKRFPNAAVEVIKADAIDLTSAELLK